MKVINWYEFVYHGLVCNWNSTFYNWLFQGEINVYEFEVLALCFLWSCPIFFILRRTLKQAYHDGCFYIELYYLPRVASQCNLPSKDIKTL